MKILFLADNYVPQTNGIVTQILTISHELERQGHTIMMVAPSFGQSVEELQQNVIRMPSLPLLIAPERLTLPWNLAIKRRLVAEQFDVIHCHQGLLALFGKQIAKACQIPYVATQHTLLSVSFDWLFPWAKPVNPYAAKFFTKLYFNQFDHIIAPSKKPLAELQAAGVKRPITWLPNAIHLATFADASPDLFLKTYDINPKTPLVIIVGRIDKGKNVDLVVAAFQTLHQRLPKAQLWIVGDGPLRSKIEQQIADLRLTDVVHITGFVDKQIVASANKAAILCVVASQVEVMPTVATEALACGKPIITVADDAILGIVEHNKNGLIVDKNVSQLSQAIERLLTDAALQTAFGNKSRALANRYDIAHYVKKLIGLYQSI